MSPEQPSPYAKRPETYVQPGTTPLVQAKSNQELTNEVIQQENAIEAMHKWVQSISDACSQHASVLNKVDVEMGTTKGKLAQYEQTMTKGLPGAEEMLNATFGKLDAIVGQLCADTTTTSAALAARAEQLEQGMAALQQSIPPGLQQGQQQGGIPQALVMAQRFTLWSPSSAGSFLR